MFYILPTIRYEILIIKIYKKTIESTSSFVGWIFFSCFNGKNNVSFEIHFDERITKKRYEKLINTRELCIGKHK